MEDLSLLLWRERELMETLLYRLEQEQLVLASGRTHWLARAAREVEAVLETLRETEVLRAMAADHAAASVGLGSNPSLKELAERAHEPWRSILLEHREALIAHARLITDLAAANRGLLTAGFRAARDTLMAMGGGPEAHQPDGYQPDGSAVIAGDPRHHLLDRSI